MPQRIHISLPVSDLDASKAFYEQLFATPASKTRSDYANFRLDTPAIHLALTLDPERARDGSDRHHFGVELESAEALASWTERLRERGQQMRIESEAECCYARADKTWVADPDGHAWELWVRLGESDRLAPPDSECCVPAAADESEATPAATSSGCC